ncbi:MAG: hypothetical protein NVSMB31_03650 [Vulcanimicrobiaceae bacterium]
MSERSEALADALGKAFFRGDFRTARRLSSELFELSKQSDDHFGMARAHNMLGNVFVHATADGETAERYYHSAMEHYRLAGDRRGVAVVTLNLGSLALDIHLDLQEARKRYVESLALFTELDDKPSIFMTMSNISELSRLEGDYTTALEYGKQCLTYFQEQGDTTKTGWQMVSIAHDLLLRSEYDESIEMLRGGYQALADDPNPDHLANYFEIWFYLACELRAYPVAAQLLGFLEEYRQANHVPRLALLMPWFSPRLEKLQRSLSYEDLLKQRAQGERMTLEQAEAATYLIAASACNDALD